MKKQLTVRRLLALTLCLMLSFHAFGLLTVADAADCQTVYTFGDPNGPFRDLAKEHEAEVKQRKKARKKAEQKQAALEKAAMIRAAREARERERREKAAKENAEKASGQSAA